MRPDVDKEIAVDSGEKPAEDMAEVTFSKEAEILPYAAELLDPSPSDSLLDITAWNCDFAFQVARTLRVVTCVDSQGDRLLENEKIMKKSGLPNVAFIEGDLNALPITNGKYDIVISYLHFHHLKNPELVFREMVRVCKEGGKVIVFDYEATTEDLRETQDAIEAMRDRKHVQNLSHEEMLDMYYTAGLTIESEQKYKVCMDLMQWFAEMNTPNNIREDIQSWMEEEVRGEEKTGFFPTRTKEGIYFNRTIMAFVGRKARRVAK